MNSYLYNCGTNLLTDYVVGIPICNWPPAICVAACYGLQPEVLVPPTVEAIRRNEDYKMEKVRELIRETTRK